MAGAWQLAMTMPNATTATVAARARARNPITRRCEIVSLLIDGRV
jgi:hypothetical protein